jgi:large subunit ribosomal protein L29
MKDKQHHKEVIGNLRSLKADELDAKLREVQEELFWLGFKHRSGQLSNTADLKKKRRALARIQTLAGELQRGGKGVVS